MIKVWEKKGVSVHTTEEVDGSWNGNIVIMNELDGPVGTKILIPVELAWEIGVLLQKYAPGARPCNGCGVALGEYHKPGCDYDLDS